MFFLICWRSRYKQGRSTSVISNGFLIFEYWHWWFVVGSRWAVGWFCCGLRSLLTFPLMCPERAKWWSVLSLETSLHPSFFSYAVNSFLVREGKAKQVRWSSTGSHPCPRMALVTEYGCARLEHVWVQGQEVGTDKVEFPPPHKAVPRD